MASSAHFFAENDEEATVTASYEHYSAMLTNWFSAEIEAEDMDNIWIQRMAQPVFRVQSSKIE